MSSLVTSLGDHNFGRMARQQFLTQPFIACHAIVADFNLFFRILDAYLLLAPALS